VSHELSQELTELRRALLTMSAGAEQRVRLALDALILRDIAAAREVRHNDREIDEMEVDVEAECLRILALHQPVATDLRFVLASVRISSELERVADLAKGIAKRVIDLDEHAPVEYPKPLIEMGDATKQMLSDALKALSELDVELAESVRRADKFVDARQRDCFDWADVELPAHIDQAHSIVDVLFIVRALERIGDHATNIAEDVIFHVGGDIVRHTPIGGGRAGA